MFERTVWMYWQQGEDRAPGIVQLCFESWRRRNPGWRVVVLDEHSLRDTADLTPALGRLDRPDLTVQKVSEIARLSLLREHGGVWADATVFCRAPLDEWLGEHVANGFFAFANPGPDRLLSSWFLAAVHDNLLLVELHRADVELWKENVYWNQNTRAGAFILRGLTSMLSRDVQRSRFWLSWPVRRLLGVHPYYQLNYVFNRLILSDQRCRDAWAAVKPFSADLPHRLQIFDQCGTGIDAAAADIAAGASPVYKLNWRVDPLSPYWAAVLEHLRATLPAA